jgi:hypothetical protein
VTYEFLGGKRENPEEIQSGLCSAQLISTNLDQLQMYSTIITNSHISYENNEGVLVGPYSQKTFLKGTNFRMECKKLELNLKNWPRF